MKVSKVIIEKLHEFQEELKHCNYSDSVLLIHKVQHFLSGHVKNFMSVTLIRNIEKNDVEFHLGPELWKELHENFSEEFI